MEEKKNFELKELRSILLFGLLLAVVHNYLRYGFDNGISIPIFYTIFMGILYYITKELSIKLNKGIYIIGGLIIVYSIFLAVRVGALISFYNYLAIYFLTLLLISLIIKSRFDQIGITDYIVGFLGNIIGIITGFLTWLSNFTALRKAENKQDRNSHIIKGIVIAVPVLVIFTSLLASADMVFNKFIVNIFSADYFVTMIGRGSTILFYTLIFVGLFTYIGFSARNNTIKEDLAIEEIKDDKHIEINIVLGCIDALFLVFIMLQVSYLFGGQAMISGQGFTYSEYATKGFIELAVIACLVFLLQWGFEQYLNRNKKTSDSSSYKTLSAFLIMLTICILVSALYRLWMYESTYGLSEIRFYGYVFMICVGFSLLIMIYKVFNFIKEGDFIINIISVFLAALFVCNIINPEGFIARNNYNRDYSGSVGRDVVYIGSMSSDAIDTIVQSYISSRKDRANLKVSLCTITSKINKRTQGWQNYNFSYSHTLKEIRSKIPNQLNCSSSDINIGNNMGY